MPAAKDMAFTQVPNLIRLVMRKHCDIYERDILWFIFDETLGHHREFHPLSPAYIAEGTGLSVTKVKSVLKALVERGFIRKHVYPRKPQEVAINLDGMLKFAAYRGHDLSKFFQRGKAPDLKQYLPSHDGHTMTDTLRRSSVDGHEVTTNKEYIEEKKLAEPPAQISPASPIAPVGALGSGEEPKQPDRIVGITFPGLGKIARESLHPRFVELFENDTQPDIDEDIDCPGESMFLDEEIDEWCYLLPYGKRRPAPRQVQVTTPAVETVDRNDEGLQNRLRAQIQEIMDRAVPVRDEQQLFPGQYAMIDGEWRQATEEDCYC